MYPVVLVFGTAAISPIIQSPGVNVGIAICSLVLFPFMLYKRQMLSVSEWWWRVLWLAMAVPHFYVHQYEVTRTIIEEPRFNLDDIWHQANATMALAFLYLNHYHGWRLYAAFYALQTACFLGFASGFTWLIPTVLFYTGAASTLLLPTLAEPTVDRAVATGSYKCMPWSALLVTWASYLIGITVMTFANPLGRLGLEMNVAGTTFIIEAFLVSFFLVPSRVKDKVAL